MQARLVSTRRSDQEYELVRSHRHGLGTAVHTLSRGTLSHHCSPAFGQMMWCSILHSPSQHATTADTIACASPDRFVTETHASMHMWMYTEGLQSYARGSSHHHACNSHSSGTYVLSQSSCQTNKGPSTSEC
jgi:hypothetical protein